MHNASGRHAPRSTRNAPLPPYNQVPTLAKNFINRSLTPSRGSHCNRPTLGHELVVERAYNSKNINARSDDSKWPVTISREGGGLIRTLYWTTAADSRVSCAAGEPKLCLRTLHWTQSTKREIWRPSEELVISDATVLVCLRRIGFCFSRGDKQVSPPDAAE